MKKNLENKLGKRYYTLKVSKGYDTTNLYIEINNNLKLKVIDYQFIHTLEFQGKSISLKRVYKKT